MTAVLSKTLSASEKNELSRLLIERERRAIKPKTSVVGIVCPEKGFLYALKRKDGKWVKTDDSPDMYLPLKMEKVLRSKKRFIVILGGRGSSKSVSVADICLVDAKDNGSRTYCLRELQNSIKNSVHSLLKEEIKRLEFGGFDVLNNSIMYKEHSVFEFAGLSRNVESIKSAHGFKRFWGEESQSLSAESLQELTPTARKSPNKGLPSQFRSQMTDESKLRASIADEILRDGVSLIFVANPGSSQDPFSKRFIVPFQDSIERDGFYEDDLHLIVSMNYMDNPWFMESGLDVERSWDYENLPRALYDHIWLGKFNDSVSSALIMAEWFDACIDAHVKLGFQPKGAKIAAHDPSDLGPDSKGYAMRHGSVVLDIQEKEDGNVNEGGHWAAKIAISQHVDSYTWDGDGLGAGLVEQNSQDFNGKNVALSMYRGSESPDYPDAIYQPAMQAPVQDQRSNSNTFRNKRAQYSFALRDRIYRTYRAVVHHEYCDPDLLISFSSSIELLSKLRAECCRIPIKPNTNGLNELYTKEDMLKKFKIASPNLFDSLVMSMRYMPPYQPSFRMPTPIRTIGGR